MNTIIVPFTRPQNFPRLVSMWRKQTVTCTLVIVPNGPAAELAVPRLPGLHAVPLRGAPSAGAARNLGVWYARKHLLPEWIAFCDDDNDYAPQYLEGMFPEGADVTCRGLGRVRWDSGLWTYSGRLGFFPGHSTTVRASLCPPFPACTGGEEIPWSRTLVACGARVLWLPPDPLIYDRRGETHGYVTDEVTFLRAHGPATHEDGHRASATDEAVFQSLERRARIRAYAS